MKSHPDDHKPNDSDEKSTSATTLQKYIRSAHVRDQYIISPRPETEDVIHLWSSDPASILDDLQPSAKKFALVGTSCLFSVAITCKITPKEATYIPKLFLLDNSQKVCEFMDDLKKVMDSVTSEIEFFNKLTPLIDKHKDSINLFLIKGFKSPAVIRKDIKKIFQDHLFSPYGFDRVRAIIRHMTVIPESWANPTVFSKIKNLTRFYNIDSSQIYLYSSNIVMWTVDNNQMDDAKNILINIKNMNAYCSIYTNLNLMYRAPTAYFIRLNENNIPELCDRLLESSLEGANNQIITQTTNKYLTLKTDFETFSKQDKMMAEPEKENKNNPSV